MTLLLLPKQRNRVCCGGLHCWSVIGSVQWCRAGLWQPGRQPRLGAQSEVGGQLVQRHGFAVPDEVQELTRSVLRMADSAWTASLRAVGWMPWAPRLSPGCQALFT